MESNLCGSPFRVQRLLSAILLCTSSNAADVVFILPLACPALGVGLTSSSGNGKHGVPKNQQMGSQESINGIRNFEF